MGLVKYLGVTVCWKSMCWFLWSTVGTGQFIYLIYLWIQSSLATYSLSPFHMLVPCDTMFCFFTLAWTVSLPAYCCQWNLCCCGHNPMVITGDTWILGGGSRDRRQFRNSTFVPDFLFELAHFDFLSLTEIKSWSFWFVWLYLRLYSRLYSCTINQEYLICLLTLSISKVHIPILDALLVIWRQLITLFFEHACY